MPLFLSRDEEAEEELRDVCRQIACFESEGLEALANAVLDDRRHTKEALSKLYSALRAAGSPYAHRYCRAYHNMMSGARDAE